MVWEHVDAVLNVGHLQHTRYKFSYPDHISQHPSMLVRHTYMPFRLKPFVSNLKFSPLLAAWRALQGAHIYGFQ